MAMPLNLQHTSADRPDAAFRAYGFSPLHLPYSYNAVRAP